jgi:hypothetical protein
MLIFLFINSAVATHNNPGRLGGLGAFMPEIHHALANFYVAENYRCGTLKSV